MSHKALCIEIDGVFYKSIIYASTAIKRSATFITRRYLSDDFPNYKIVPFRVDYTEKKCTTCENIRSLSEFSKNIGTKDRLSNKCKFCEKEYNKEYCNEHREEIKENNKAYRDKNREELNKDNRQYYQDHKVEMNMYNAEYQKTHKEEINARKREKYETDIIYKINKNMSNAMNQSLKNGKGEIHWWEAIGYNYEELKAHLEKQFLPGMTWENHGSGEGKWEIDHIIPLYWFVFKKHTDKGFKKAWALENLRPMWSGANQSKGKKLFC